MNPHNRSGATMLLLRAAAEYSPVIAEVIREHEEREARIRRMADMMGDPSFRLPVPDPDDR